MPWHVSNSASITRMESFQFLPKFPSRAVVSASAAGRVPAYEDVPCALLNRARFGFCFATRNMPKIRRRLRNRSTGRAWWLR